MAGVPALPPPVVLVLPPPQAGISSRPPRTRITSDAPNIFFLRDSEPRPKPSSTSPPTGRKVAYSMPTKLLFFGWRRTAVGAVVLTVSVAAAVVVADAALQVGPSVTTGETAQVSVTVPPNPFGGVTVTVDVAEDPGPTVPGESAVAESEKVGAAVDCAYLTTKASWVPPPFFSCRGVEGQVKKSVEAVFPVT